MLLAACEATSLSERIFGVGIALAVLAFWFGVAWLVVWLEREPEERWALVGILVFSGGLTTAALTGLHESLETLALPGLVTLLVVGAGGGHLLRVGIPRGVGAALTGAAFLPLAVVVILLFSTFLGGTCLGEELG
jgi:hypothetical protein